MAEDEEFYEDAELDLDEGEGDVEMWEEAPEFITLDFDDGTSERCEVICVFPSGGKQYAALAPDADPDSLYIYGFVEGPDGGFDLVDIEDDGEFEAASAELENYLE